MLSRGVKRSLRKAQIGDQCLIRLGWGGSGPLLRRCSYMYRYRYRSTVYSSHFPLCGFYPSIFGASLFSSGTLNSDSFRTCGNIDKLFFYFEPKLLFLRRRQKALFADLSREEEDLKEGVGV